MVKPKVLLFPGPGGGDTPELKSPLASTEDQSQESSDTMVMERDSVKSNATEQNNEGYVKILDHIQEKASSILKFSLQFDDMSDSLEKEEEQLIVVKVRDKEVGLMEEKQSEEAESKLDSLLDSMTKKLEDLMSEFERKKEEGIRISESILEKLSELEKAKKDFDLKKGAETERWNEESEAREKELRALEEAIKEKTAELKRKEENFELKLKEEADKWRVETDLKRKDLEIKEKTMEKKLKEIELKQMKLEERSKHQGIIAKYKKRSNLKRKPLFPRHMYFIHLKRNFDLKQRAETERRHKESQAREKELNSLEEAIKEKSAELKRKEEHFELQLKQEVDKWREENELKRKGLEIKEKALEKGLKELELMHMKMEEKSKQQPVEAESRKRSNHELEPPLLVHNSSDAASLTRQAKKQKSHEANDEDIEGIVCTDKSDEDPKSVTCPDTKFNDFSDSMNSFAVDQVWALYDPRDDMPSIYAQMRKIFDSQLSLQVTLLEPVKTTEDEKSIISGCGRFKYGETEIKSYLMFAHEMDHIICAEDVIVNPRKGETWALFRDWNTNWKNHSDLYEPPYRYDFVEVISEFEDLLGIGVAYMGRVEGFASVFNHAEQHGLIKIIISPGEMQRFSHKVASVKLSGDEKEEIPAGSFKLNPAATPSYDPVLKEAVKMEIQSKDCGKAPTVVDQNGSTKDQPIIID